MYVRIHAVMEYWCWTTLQWDISRDEPSSLAIDHYRRFHICQYCYLTPNVTYTIAYAYSVIGRDGIRVEYRNFGIYRIKRHLGRNGLHWPQMPRDEIFAELGTSCIYISRQTTFGELLPRDFRQSQATPVFVSRHGSRIGTMVSMLKTSLFAIRLCSAFIHLLFSFQMLDRKPLLITFCPAPVSGRLATVYKSIDYQQSNFGRNKWAGEKGRHIVRTIVELYAKNVRSRSDGGLYFVDLQWCLNCSGSRYSSSDFDVTCMGNGHSRWVTLHRL